MSFICAIPIVAGLFSACVGDGPLAVGYVCLGLSALGIVLVTEKGRLFSSR